MVEAFPKPTRKKLTRKEKTEIRRQVFDREHGICQLCHEYATWEEGDLCHIKSRGAGGSWDLDNLYWAHHTCHMNEHSKGKKWAERRLSWGSGR